MAYQLHNLYGGLEQLFEEVAGTFENQVEGEGNHTGLLRRMKLRIEGIRPALLSPETAGDSRRAAPFQAPVPPRLHRRPRSAQSRGDRRQGPGADRAFRRGSPTVSCSSFARSNPRNKRPLQSVFGRRAPQPNAHSDRPQTSTCPETALLAGFLYRVNRYSGFSPRAFIGNDQGVFRREGDAFSLAMPFGGKLPDGQDLPVGGELRYGTLTCGHDEVVPRGRVPLDSGRLKLRLPEFFQRIQRQGFPYGDSLSAASWSIDQ